MRDKLRIILLADPFSAHTVKWANGLFSRDIDVTVFGLSGYDRSQYLPGVNIVTCSIPDSIKYRSDGNPAKILYLLALPRLKRVIKQNGDTILHAHSGSSYGLLGALAGYKPFLISVWGTDVFNFPRKSSIFRNILSYNLSKADGVFSTSRIMADETKKYTDKPVEIIHFGVDTDKFRPGGKRFIFGSNDIVIGTVKGLEHKYGITDLVNAFIIMKKKYTEDTLKLLLVGRGSLETEIRKIVREADLTDCVKITGYIPYNDIVKYHNEMDIMVAVSSEDSESFGVAVLEALACEKAVIVSDKGGLKEIVEDNISGLIVPAKSPEFLSRSLEKLILNPELRINLGKAGRERVKGYFTWEESLDKMIKGYEKIRLKYFSSQ